MWGRHSSYKAVDEIRLGTNSELGFQNLSLYQDDPIISVSQFTFRCMDHVTAAYLL